MLKQKYPNIEFTDKMALKAKLDILMLDFLPSKMGIDVIMKISGEAFQIIATYWNDWLEGRIEK